MDEGSAADLIRLADEESSVVVRVLGRTMPGVLTLHDHLDAEIVVLSGFARGRLEVCLAPNDLDDWADVLGEAAAGRNAVWMDDGRNPQIGLDVSDEDGFIVVSVEDVAVSGTSVRIPVRLSDGWADDHHERLRRVRAVWPREVESPFPGAYQWRRS
ncbi:DUF5959 family protein [Cryptosporangium japonicum]|uniref:DUF5959 family protein n=1 Tax=Cryptosporangium japonicum TaxID=80872 RepID=A0ABN0UZ72_9ACTN